MRIAIVLVVGALETFAQTGSAVAAQAPNACGLLTSEEVQALAPKEPAEAGVPSEIPSLDSSVCYYTWGTGTKRLTLTVSVNAASRLYVGMNADAIKQSLESSIAPGTADATIPDVGVSAVFKTYSPAYAGARALVKDRVLQIALDGWNAPDRKPQLMTLLKSAASRL